MQTFIRMNMVVIEGYYHRSTMDENINWMKLTHPLSNFPRNLRAFYCTSNLNFKILNTFLNVHTREKLCLSLMYAMHTIALNNTPFHTHNIVFMQTAHSHVTFSCFKADSISSLAECTSTLGKICILKLILYPPMVQVTSS